MNSFNIIRELADSSIRVPRMNANANKSKNDAKVYKVQRSSPRFAPTAFPSLKSACLVSGSEVKLINISKGGALLECGERLAPSTRVSLRFITSGGVIQLYGQVLRSTISHLDGGLRYRSAVAFEQDFPLQPESDPAERQPEAKAASDPQPSPSQEPDPRTKPQPGAEQAEGDDDGRVTLTAHILENEPELCKLFEINKW